jgi:hypothetical protein
VKFGKDAGAAQLGFIQGVEYREPRSCELQGAKAR